MELMRKNGIAFQDANEIWWLETIGGHHWIARRVPDDSYVVMPNQLGLDVFDLKMPYLSRRNMCSADSRNLLKKIIWISPLMTALNLRMLFAAMRTLTMYTIPQEPGSVFAISIPIP